MKFNKAVLIGIGEGSMDAAFWQQLDAFMAERSFAKPDDADILKNLADADAVFVGFGIAVTAEMMEAAPKLRYIGVLATAFGKIDIVAAGKKGIVVSNLAGYSTEAVAELVFAMLLENLRGIEEGKTRVRNGSVSEDGIRARELRGHPFGVIGLRKIGQRIAEIAQGFGADVRYWSRTRRPKVEKQGMKYQELDALIAECDYLALSLAQTAETEGIINAARFAAFKTDAVLVNIAPMELVDIPGLEARLSKKDFTFILDHSDQMKAEDLDSLRRFPNCIMYPPIGYITDEARQARKDIFLGNIQAFLKGKLENVVS